MSNNQLITCSLCGSQHPITVTTPADIPILNNHDHMKLVNKKICKSCQLILLQIEQFIKEVFKLLTKNRINYSNHDFKCTLLKYIPPRKNKTISSLQLLYTATQNNNFRNRNSSDMKNAPKRLSMSTNSLKEQSVQEIHPYLSFLIQELVQKNYHTLTPFSKTLQHLIYMSSLPKGQKQTNCTVGAEERHEKVKHIVLQLAERVHLAVEELPYCLYFINFLLCLMDPPKVISVMLQLSNAIITYSQMLSWKQLLEQDRHHSQIPLSPATTDLKNALIRVDKLWARIEWVIELSRKGEVALREGLIKMSSVQMVLSSKEYSKKLSQVLRPLMLKGDETDGVSEGELKLLYLMKLQRNSFSLVLHEAMEEEEENRQQIVHMNHKWKMEKEEYIEKIIKLSNQIEQMKEKINQLESSQTNNCLKCKEIKQEKINQMKIEVLPPKEEQKKIIHSEKIYLQEITNAINQLNTAKKNKKQAKKIVKVEPQKRTIEEITAYIIKEFQKIKENCEQTNKKLKAIEDEKNKLLSIINRKEQRYISVITEKDTIIQSYEQALWSMQNGQVVEDGPLACRIEYIMHIFSKQIIEEQQETPCEKLKNKQKGREKECEIY